MAAALTAGGGSSTSCSARIFVRRTATSFMQPISKCFSSLRSKQGTQALYLLALESITEFRYKSQHSSPTGHLDCSSPTRRQPYYVRPHP